MTNRVLIFNAYCFLVQLYNLKETVFGILFEMYKSTSIWVTRFQKRQIKPTRWGPTTCTVGYGLDGLLHYHYSASIAFGIYAWILLIFLCNRRHLGRVPPPATDGYRIDYWPWTIHLPEKIFSVAYAVKYRLRYNRNLKIHLFLQKVHLQQLEIAVKYLRKA